MTVCRWELSALLRKRQAPQSKGSRHAPGFIAKFIMKEDTLHGKKHLIKFNGGDDELKTLSQWLEGLKAPADSTKK
jgi:hypothetical protein